MKKLTIIIPAYNEEKRIGKTLQEYCSFFSDKNKSKNVDANIMIIINNTKDKTEEIVKKYCKKYKILSYLNFKRGGKGFAVTEGFKEALKFKNDLIGFVDSDLSTKPEEYYRLASNIGKYDAIIASRYVSGAIVNPKPTLQRRIVSRIFNLLVRTLFLINYRDTQCGAKIFKKEVIRKIIDKLGITQWAFDIDLLYQIKKANFRVKEEPTVWSDSDYSKINLKSSGTYMVLGVIRLRILNSKIKSLVRIYDKLIKIIPILPK
jgi:glycosyltransferase involved in cell wall biosynthesis